MSRLLWGDEAVMFLFLKSHPKAFFFVVFFTTARKKKLQVKIDIINSGMLSQGTHVIIILFLFVLLLFFFFYTGLILCTRNLHSLK